MITTRTSLVRNAAGKPVATMTRTPGVAAAVIDGSGLRPSPGPVTRVASSPGFDTFTTVLDASSGAKTFKIGDGDNLAEIAIGGTYDDPTSTGISGLTGAILNASFSDSPVKVTALNIEVSTSANQFSTPMKKIYGERNGDFEGKVINLANGRSSADYNPKIRIIEFQPGLEPVLSRNRGIIWAVNNGEIANIVWTVGEYRE
jgi:hypothetical protein